MGELRKIPNVGRQTERYLIAMGYDTIESLKGKRADELYEQECAMRGVTVDRCQLYLYRAVEYYVNTTSPDPKKLPWWRWKDDFALPSPCGAVCSECARYPSECGGCRLIKGKAHWLAYTGAEICPVYDCCVNVNKRNDCGKCGKLPCEKFTKDPTVSDEQNRANLEKMIKNLKGGAL